MRPGRDEREQAGPIRAVKGAPEPLSNQGLISKGVVTLLRDLTGRGATRATTTIGSDHVVVLLYEALTKTETLLAREGHRDYVIASRQAIQDAMRPQAIRLVEETLRRKVVGFLSANQIDPDIAAAIFVLAPAEDDAKAEGAEGAAPH
jgi:uncharacterized protein YbcI